MSVEVESSNGSIRSRVCIEQLFKREHQLRRSEIQIMAISLLQSYEKEGYRFYKHHAPNGA